MDTTRRLIALRSKHGAWHPTYVMACSDAGRCVDHPAYEPNNCPSCGTNR